MTFMILIIEGIEEIAWHAISVTENSHRSASSLTSRRALSKSVVVRTIRLKASCYLCSCSDSDSWHPFGENVTQ